MAEEGQERPDPRKDPKVVKIMAQLMAQGATMLEQTCPICGLPLFRLRSGDVVCPLHGKVYIVSSDEEAREVEIDDAILKVEYAAAIRARDMAIKGELDGVSDLLMLVEAAERIRRLRLERSRMTAPQQPPAPSPEGARREERASNKEEGSEEEE